VTLRELSPSDQPAVEDFLSRTPAATMFLRSNIRASGLTARDQPFHGVYMGCFDNAGLTDVAAHYWSGNIIMYAPTAAAELAKALVARTQKDVKGFLGPWAQCMAALDALNLHHRAREPHCEDLFQLDLKNINAPQLSGVSHRRAQSSDLDFIIQCRIDYEIETLGSVPGAALEASARANVDLVMSRRDMWVATHDGVPVAMSAINARLPDMVQVGGVHTPKHLRGRGYAKVVVAGSIADCRDEGARTAILFTEVRNTSAKRVYTSLGFQRVGDYGLILLD
jgi:uncharacterized protein